MVEKMKILQNSPKTRLGGHFLRFLYSQNFSFFSQPKSSYIRLDPYKKYVYSTNINNVKLDELIKKCITRDRRACESLYHIFYPSLMPTVRRYISDSQIAEEVLHNAFIKIFKNLKQYKYEGSFDGWMRRITFHCVSDYIRSTTKYRENVYTTDENYFFDMQQRASDEMDYQYYMSLIEALPTQYRTVFNLYVIDGYKHKEIAEMLDIPEGTSKWYLSEAKKILQEEILKNKNISR